MIDSKYKPEEITYELLGIDPAEFYRTKFDSGQGLENALANPVFRYEVGYEKIRRLITDLQTLLPGGGKVLDVGCGAGSYGPTLLANVPMLALYGIDMSETCLLRARANGYTECFGWDFAALPLPYEDETFDAVISMDMLGHIEFRRKDFLIRQMARVTKHGGIGHHGVETGYIDYYSCNPRDEADPVRRYVYVDGHIGVEPAQDLCARLAKHFRQVSHQMTYLFPFLYIDHFADIFEEEFKQVVAGHSHPEARQLALVILGRLNQHFVELYTKVFGAAFQPTDAAPPPLTPAHAQARAEMQQRLQEYQQLYGTDFVPVPRELFRPAGFSSITLKK